jgi:hypothetical protein
VKPVELVLERAEGVRKDGAGWLVSCPLPGHGKGYGDRKPSVSVAEGEDGRALVLCRAGCQTGAVLDGWGLKMRDLFLDGGPREDNDKFERVSLCSGATVQPPFTLGVYAELKRLPVDFLKGLGLADKKHAGGPAVRIPYRNPDGLEVAVRFRLALEKEPEGDNRFRWRTGSKAMLYGLWRLEVVREAGYVVLVEGESDCHTLWFHGIPALGVPGAGTWKDDWAGHLEGLGCVYAIVEPDGGGDEFRKKLAGCVALRDRLHLVDLGDQKDPSSLYLTHRQGFGERFAVALKSAVRWADLARTEAEEAARKAWGECEELAWEPDILERMASELARSGVAGESRVAKLLYLAVTSRVLQKPVSVAVKGPSSGGKSHLTERVLGFFPESAYYALTAMSERALAYSEEPLEHRFLVIYEAAGMNSDFQTYLVRSLLSEGKVRYETVEKTAEGMKPRLIEREGPTGLIVTTTAVKLHPENETRMLSLTVTDTQEQTRAVMAALAEESGGEQLDMRPWHALQGWIKGAEHRVTIPYAKDLAALIPPVAVRLRRDFGALLTLIRAHAVLHQASRERDADGRIVAGLEDYASVRELVADLVSEGVEATVPETLRETVETLKCLHARDGKPVTVAALAADLGLDKSATSRRARTAVDRGHLNNLEDRKGRPAQLVPGDALPERLEILPEPGRLRRCTVATGHEGINKQIFPGMGPEREVFAI